MSAIDLDAAVATYWSGMRVGVTDADVAAAWTAAAHALWKDEVHVGERDGVTVAGFLFNSGHMRAEVCECALLVAPVWNRTTNFLTVVLSASDGLNLGWALHTRTLDGTWGEGWSQPFHGAEAVRNWSDFERLRC